MVSIDYFYKILEKTKKEILKRFEEINVESYPVDFAWLLYALQGEKDCPFFDDMLEKLKVWSFSEASETNDKNIGALAVCAYFMRDCNDIGKILEKIKTILRRNFIKHKFRHNVLNDPSEMFLVSLISDYLDISIKNQLLKIATKNINGPPPRKMLFLASCINLGASLNDIETIAKKTSTSLELRNIESVITTLWFYEKYDILTEEIPSLLIKFNEMFFEVEEDDRIPLPTHYLALLYELINKEFANPHPLTLFSLYPFDDELRKIIEDYFKSKKYSIAISEALKKIKELLKEKATERGMDITKIEKFETKERVFIRELLNPRIPQNYQERDPKKIPLKFSELKDKGELNFQEGMALLLEGAWTAFRHPEAHYPENHQARNFDAYETIAILILIDYLWKKIKKIKFNQEVSKNDKPRRT